MDKATDARKQLKPLGLVYVCGDEPGITRKRVGKNFTYSFRGKPVRNAETLQRIRKLVIPPAWENVWICANENGHLQATGYDVRGRKQYRYHAAWSAARNETKFHRLSGFGASLEKIRERVQHDLALKGLPLDKVLATVITLMELTGIRIGSNEYEKLYGSYGLTTMKDQHVQLSGTQIKFAFKGKKGVRHTITVRNARLAKIVKQCRDIPGKELFQYYDENGKRHTIDSGMVNHYLKEITGEDFTSKDFRTWVGTFCAFVSFKKIAQENLPASVKDTVVSVLDEVAQQLGNTRAVCKKYYVHPVLIELFEKQEFGHYLAPKKPKAVRGLNDDEQLLLHVLEKAAA